MYRGRSVLEVKTLAFSFFSSGELLLFRRSMHAWGVHFRFKMNVEVPLRRLLSM
ncbi:MULTISPECIES: hypothetical protein [unclassified Bartonella]|uniref:hypothetical protein n=1 Tax=unclassified Bartonella TaxID=2645622 RepID=UPI0035CFEFAD